MAEEKTLAVSVQVFQVLTEERHVMKRHGKPNRNQVDVTSSHSSELVSIIEVHQYNRDEDRIAHHWVGRRPSAQEWELPQSIARLVTAAIPAFLSHAKLLIHGTVGENGGMPELETILTQEGSIRAPQNVTYFLEDQKNSERLILAVSKCRMGTREIRVVADDSGTWINRIRAFAKEQNFLRGQVFDLDGEIVPLKGLSLEDVILTPDQAVVVHRHIIGFSKLVHQLEGIGARKQRGVLLEGEPGCGKSMLLRAITSHMNGMSVCLASPRQISSMDGVENLKTLIEMTAPCAVFMEEIDIFGKDRSMRHSPAMADLMQLMDGLQNIPGILWVATTNRSKELERALADRPGRFDRRITFGPLDDQYRAKLIAKLMEPSRLESDAQHWLLRETQGYSGAQIREICDTVRLLAVEQEISMDVFSRSILSEAISDCGFNSAHCSFGFKPVSNETLA